MSDDIIDPSLTRIFLALQDEKTALIKRLNVLDNVEKRLREAFGYKASAHLCEKPKRTRRNGMTPSIVLDAISKCPERFTVADVMIAIEGNGKSVSHFPLRRHLRNLVALRRIVIVQENCGPNPMIFERHPVVNGQLSEGVKV